MQITKEMKTNIQLKIKDEKLINVKQQLHLYNKTLFTILHSFERGKKKSDGTYFEG